MIANPEYCLHQKKISSVLESPLLSVPVNTCSILIFSQLFKNDDMLLGVLFTKLNLAVRSRLLKSFSVTGELIFLLCTMGALG
jgi:hypothetical protein